VPPRLPLTVVAAQPRCTAGDVAANVRAHADTVRRAGARVVVFPELSLTGYELDAPALDPADSRLAPLVEACADAGSLALAGAPLPLDGGGRSLGVLAVDGTSAHVAYRKMCLGGAEPAHFTPGTEPGVVAVDGWRLGLAVCRDMGVAEQAARTAALGIDAYVAGAVDTPEDAAVQEERALRVGRDHGVPVVVASFAGPTGGGYDRTAGRSGVWAADGTRLARCRTEPGETARAVLVG
jgi:predicted amidohydrolase